MSIVSGVTLHIDTVDAPDWDNTESKIHAIQKWLAEHDFGPLVDVTKHAGGNKYPQVHVFMAGYNHFHSLHEEFAEFVIALPWETPEGVVLIINPEEGAPVVYRCERERWVDP